MFNHLRNVFKDILELADERETRYKERKREPIVSLDELMNQPDMEEDEGLEEINKKLYDYFSELSFENIKIIQTIMYLGRDKDYDKNNPPELIYQKFREDFDKCSGWSEKNIEISQMIQKIPFNIYLRNGLEILNIKL